MLIRGPVGVPAHFVVKQGEEILSFDPVRRERTIVSAQMLDTDTAYVAQSAFTTDAPQEMKEALQGLLDQHPQELIWDLRDNGGGSMEATQQVLSYFVEDVLLFTAELKGGKEELFVALEGAGKAADIPLVVLIGEYTYSAGETAAATITERERGTLIGSTTYGKGTINATFQLIEDCMLQMTIAKWLSTTGEWYNERGVPPDIFVDDDPHTDKDEVLEFAVDYIRQTF